MEQNHESIKVINEKLKGQLSIIKLSVEDAFSRYNNNTTSKGVQDDNDDLNEAILFKETVEKFKILIEELNNKIANSYQYRQIGIKEEELNNSKKFLENIIKENVLFVKVKKRQVESLRIMENKYNNQIERSIMTEKIKNLKEELKLIKEYYKISMDNVKGQQKKIEELNAQCDVIKNNINHYKDKDNEGNVKQLSETGMKTLEEKIDLKMEYNKKEEEYYLEEIKKQKEKVDKINEEIDIIRIKIKQKDQEIHMSQIKIRELKKLTALLNLNQKKQEELHRDHQHNETSGSLQTIDMKKKKFNMFEQLQVSKLNDRSRLNYLRDNYSFINKKKKNNDNTTTGAIMTTNGNSNSDKIHIMYNRGYSAKNKIKREYDKYATEGNKDQVMIEIEELKMNIQKVLNENNFYYNNTILNKKKIEIIQKEDYGNKDNRNMNSGNRNDKGNNSGNGLMELTHNYDKVNYDYLDKLPYTIEQQNNDITITRNDNTINKDKDEEKEENEENTSTLFQPQINKSRYNENMIVFVKENELNYLYPTISKDLTNNQNENESKRKNENENSPQIKLFSKLEIKSRRKPFEISNFNKEEQANQ